MTTVKPLPYKMVKPKLLYTASIALMAFILGAHFFVTNVVYPNIEFGSFIIDVPAKSGGTTYYADQNEFQTTSYIATAIFAVVVLAVLVLMNRQKKEGAALMLSFFVTGAALYVAVLLGNAFHELWRGWWAVAGVAVAIVIAVGIQVLIAFSFKKVDPNDPINP